MTPDQAAIILLSTMFPAAAVGFILYRAGKTMGYAWFGALVVYCVSLAGLIALLQLAAVWPNMPFQAFLLILPFAVAGLFVWQFKGRGPNR